MPFFILNSNILNDCSKEVSAANKVRLNPLNNQALHAFHIQSGKFESALCRFDLNLDLNHELLISHLGVDLEAFGLSHGFSPEVKALALPLHLRPEALALVLVSFVTASLTAVTSVG